MGRPKGSKNKITKGKAERAVAKAKAKAKPPTKAEQPDWLRKAMAIPPKRKGRPPGTKNNRPKIEPQTLKRGKKPMANKPLYDPLDDPDLRSDAPIIDPPKPGIGDNLKPGIDNTLPGSGSKPDQSLPGAPVRPGQKPALPGGGVAPDNALPEPEEPESLDGETPSGEVIPADYAQMLIAGTLGGGGDQHASAKRILARFEEAGWEVRKALDAGTGDSTKSKKTTAKKGKDEDEADAKRAKY